MKKQTVISLAAAFIIGALTPWTMVLTRPATQVEASSKIQEEVTDKSALLKSGYYYGMSIDQGIKRMAIDTVQEKFILNFTQSIDSYFCAGQYTVEGDRLIASGCTFKIEKDGSLVLLEDESPYFETKPSPFFASFEDGTVFTFGGKLEAGLHFGS